MTMHSPCAKEYRRMVRKTVIWQDAVVREEAWRTIAHSLIVQLSPKSKLFDVKLNPLHKYACLVQAIVLSFVLIIGLMLATTWATVKLGGVHFNE